MPTQHDIEAEVHATVHAFLKAWVQQGAGATDHFLTYVAEDFTGLGTAHEIKNPLNFVNNFAALSRELADELAEEVDEGTDAEAIKAILSDLKTNAAKIEGHGRQADGIVRAMMQHAYAGGSGARADL